MNYHLICGMEIHAELKTKSKMFCGCKNDPFHALQPNSYTCPVCLGMPGALPVPNKTAIEWTIKLGLALNCQINLFSKFDRKHYFYPDLPKGYQISQYDVPFCYGGYIETEQGRVRITRIHLEEDTGKLMHTTIEGKKVSLIDFNRSSVPLIEIVTEPDIHTTEQAVAYAKSLRQLIRYLEIGDCDMEQGGMRLEANLSLQSDQQKSKDQLPDYKVELKNINSFRFLKQAMEFEVKRQTAELATGKTPKQETRGWNATKGQSYSQRSKEDAEDYRYFPDPDIPPIHFTQKQVDQFQKELPELPNTVIDRWQTDWGVEPRFGEQLIETATHTAWLDQVFKLSTQINIDPNKVASGFVNKKLSIDTKQSPQAIVNQIKKASATSTIDETELATIIEKVLSAHPTEVARYQTGETKLLGFFLGKIRQQLPDQVDMKHVTEMLQNLLR